MERSHIPLQKWIIGLYLMNTNLKGVSSMKLHRDLGITQKSAWFMADRIRKTWEEEHHLFQGPVEVDETYIGGKERNKPPGKKLNAGRGAVGKIPVAGVKDRGTKQVSAAVVERTTQEELEGFISERVQHGSQVYTDDHKGYGRLWVDFEHSSVRHSVKEFVKGKAHINGIESFWALLKRGYYGIYHHMSEKHLQRYVDEFAGRHNARTLDTIQQMTILTCGMERKRLTYKELTKGA